MSQPAFDLYEAEDHVPQQKREDQKSNPQPDPG